MISQKERATRSKTKKVELDDITDRMLIESAASGLSIEKVDMDVEELLAWCNVRGMALNGKARSQYVSEKLRQKYEES